MIFRGATIFVEVLRTVCSFLVDAYFLRRWPDGKTTVAPRHLRKLLERLGPTFIKLGQILSCRPDLLSEGWIRELSLLQDNVAPVSINELVPTIVAAIGGPISGTFSKIEPGPIASGSIAQVHLATLRNGMPVALKVQRPDVEQKIESDISILRCIGRVAAKVRFFRSVPLQDVVAELSHAIVAQLDFEHEAERYALFRQRLEGYEYVKIPVVHREISGRKLIVMEYLAKLLKLNDRTVGVRQRTLCAERAADILFTMIFVFGDIHGDLHYGNIFTSDDFRIYILDFGFVASMDSQLRHRFADFFWSVSYGNGKKCAEILIKTATNFEPWFDAVSFARAIEELVARFASKKASDFEVGLFSYELFNIHRKHGIRPTAAFTFAIMALLVLEGVIKELDPEMPFQERAKRILGPVVARLQ